MPRRFYPQLFKLEESENFNTVNQALAAAIQSLLSALYYIADAVLYFAQDMFICVMTRYSSLPSLGKYKGFSQEYDS